MGKRCNAAILLLLACICPAGRADEIWFKNGDRLTGRIVELEQKKLKIASDVAGEISVDLEKIDRFTTTAAVSIILEDGTAVHRRVALYQDGQFHLAQEEPTTAPTTAAIPQTAPAPATTSATQEAAPELTLGTPSIPLKDIRRIKPEKATWSGAISAGLILTRGNTDSDTVNARFEAKGRGDHNELNLNGSYLYGRDTDPDTGSTYVSKDNWQLFGQYNQYLSRRWYLYAGGRAEHDSIANLYLRATPGGGVGYRWIEGEHENLNTEVGLNWVHEEYRNPTQTSDYLAGRYAHHYDRRLGEATKLTHNFEILPNVVDFSDYVMKTDIGLRFKITGRLFSELRVELTYDSKPAEDSKEADVRYIANLGYEF